MPYYPGFCTKYNSSSKVLLVGTFAPAVLNPAFTAAVTTFQGESLPKITAVATASALIGAASGVAGFVSGADMHNRVNQKLTARHTNMEEGGKIVRKAQAAAYAVPVAAAAVFNMAFFPWAVNVTKMEKEDTHQSADQMISQVDAVHPMKQAEKHIADPAEYRADVNLDAFIVTFDVTPETLSPAYS
jgi:hypothetical protein